MLNLANTKSALLSTVVFGGALVLACQPSPPAASPSFASEDISSSADSARAQFGEDAPKRRGQAGAAGQVLAEPDVTRSRTSAVEKGSDLGQVAMPFELPNATGGVVALEDYRSYSNVVLVFYRGFW